MIKLYPHQLEALDKIHNGCILHGGVGTGKSITALAWLYLHFGGSIKSITGGEYVRLKEPLLDIYIITTAKKRDSLEWEDELRPFYWSTDPKTNLYGNKVVIDSWNNITKYKNVISSFFIFDEQKVVGKGVWAKTFINITKANEWILLSATPGDVWSDYIPVFIANGFYRNRSEFERQHVIYKPFTDFPQIDRYVGVRRLERLRDKILVDMNFERSTVPHHETIPVEYDKQMYKYVTKNRWDIFADEPITSPSGYTGVLRRIVNSDESRALAVLEIMENHPKVIIFYTFDYERDILLGLGYPEGTEIAEWNGHKHQEVPTGDKWVYLVQYTAGNDGWNCITTDTIIFYSMNHSYKMTHQAEGRIDRLNTRYTDLWYYRLMSRSSVDLSIARALEQKKDFNARRFTRGIDFTKETIYA